MRRPNPIREPDTDPELVSSHDVGEFGIIVLNRLKVPRRGYVWLLFPIKEAVFPSMESNTIFATAELCLDAAMAMLSRPTSVYLKKMRPMVWDDKHERLISIENPYDPRKQR